MARQAKQPKVINLRNPEHRRLVQQGLAKRADRQTKWGNPFVTGRDGTRDEVIAKHKAWLADNFSDEDLAELRGWDLACWCAPLSCHCDELLRRANQAPQASGPYCIHASKFDEGLGQDVHRYAGLYDSDRGDIDPGAPFWALTNDTRIVRFASQKDALRFLHQVLEIPCSSFPVQYGDLTLDLEQVCLDSELQYS